MTTFSTLKFIENITKISLFKMVLVSSWWMVSYLGNMTLNLGKIVIFCSFAMVFLGNHMSGMHVVHDTIGAHIKELTDKKPAFYIEYFSCYSLSNVAFQKTA